MYEQHIHAYEQLSLPTAGIIMGMVLIVLHLIAIIKPGECMQLLTSAHKATKAGQILLGIDFIWVALLLFDAEWNPLRMDLFEFNNMRGILLILCPIIWFVMSSMCKENLLPRALGMFLLLMAIVPLSAAFLKEPLTRLLIPIWCIRCSPWLCSGWPSPIFSAIGQHGSAHTPEYTAWARGVAWSMGGSSYFVPFFSGKSSSFLRLCTSWKTNAIRSTQLIT